jgi:hypothetical protein
MVGAKQFAIMRKIIEDKKENPIVKNIAMPPWLKGEKELHSLSGSFLDKFNFNPHISEKPSLETKIQKIKKVTKNTKENPIVKNITKPLSVMKVNDIREFSESLFDKFNFLTKIITKSQKASEPQIIKEEKPKEEDTKEISEKMLNRLTYDVFQNIKDYLDYHPINKSQIPEKNKHIKLEISL